MIRRALCLCCAFGLFIPTIAMAGAACPASTYHAQSSSAQCDGSTPASFAQFFDPCAGNYISFDHAAGVHKVGGGTPSQGSASATARANDTFTLIGSGTDPVPLTAILSLTGNANVCSFGGQIVSARMDASLVRPGVDSVATGFYPGFGAGPNPVSLTFNAIPGVPFDLSVVLSAGGGTYCLEWCCSYGSAIIGTLTFSGIPSGDYLVSCKGYGLGVVPTRTTSWGRIKQIYR